MRKDPCLIRGYQLNGQVMMAVYKLLIATQSYIIAPSRPHNMDTPDLFTNKHSHHKLIPNNAVSRNAYHDLMICDGSSFSTTCHTEAPSSSMSNPVLFHRHDPQKSLKETPYIHTHRRREQIPLYASCILCTKLKSGISLNVVAVVFVITITDAVTWPGPHLRLVKNIVRYCVHSWPVALIIDPRGSYQGSQKTLAHPLERIPTKVPLALVAAAPRRQYQCPGCQK